MTAAGLSERGSAADLWFGRKPGPNDAIADYANAPVSGMTNPPHNAKVRKMLLKKLTAYNVKAEPDRPRPPAPVLDADDDGDGPSKLLKSKMPRRGEQQSAWAKSDEGLSFEGVIQERPANMVVVIGNRGRHPPSAPSSTSSPGADEEPSPLPAEPPAVTAAPASQRPGGHDSSAPRGQSVLIRQSSSSALQSRSNAAPMVAFKEPAVQEDAEEAPGHRMLNAIVAKENERLRRGPQNGQLTAKLFVDEKSSDAAKRTKKEKKDEDGSKVVRRVKSDSEIRNEMMALRTMARMHRSTVADRQKFPSDLTNTATMVLKGPAAVANHPSTWSSDSSYLTFHHNKAMRTVGPSGLLLAPVPEKRRRKKGDTKEEKELQDSGYRPLYQPDNALAELRKVRHILQPPQKQKRLQAVRQEKAMSLLAELGGQKLMGTGSALPAAWAEYMEEEESIEEKQAALEAFMRAPENWGRREVVAGRRRGMGSKEPAE